MLTMQRTFDDLGTPLADVTFCVLDLETTGGARDTDRITEIGAVKVRGGEVLGTFHTLVNPGRAIPPSIMVLTGLTDAIVMDAPRIEAVLPSLLEFCRDTVIVGHNIRFDIGFLDAALVRAQRPRLSNPSVDTVALARRLVRDEVPDCRLATLAARFRLDHKPSHRAFDDALATTDLFHLLLERAATHGVLGFDDLQLLPRIGGHPQVAKLKMTSHLPRCPGIYRFHDARGEIIYVGKATNLRQRVRSYFGSDDRRKIGAMLREAQRVTHVETPDVLSAEVLELRTIQAHMPRYNRQGTGFGGYCYVRLDVDQPWPRLTVTRDAKPGGVHLGPLPSRTMANLVIEAIHGVVPLRRCTTRIGRKTALPLVGSPCTAAQLGVAECPCAGGADGRRYARAVATVVRGLTAEVDVLLAPLHERMVTLARSRRFEEAAAVRDRARALSGAVRRQRMMDALRRAGRVELRAGDVEMTIDGARLVELRAGGGLPFGLPLEPAPATSDDLPLGRQAVDEALCIARYLDRHASRVELRACSGEWSSVLAALPTFEPVRTVTRAA
jgi:DNA polymerase-3 subunit epsilon